MLIIIIHREIKIKTTNEISLHTHIIYIVHKGKFFFKVNLKGRMSVIEKKENTQSL